jgi:hypothetical protein
MITPYFIRAAVAAAIALAGFSISPARSLAATISFACNGSGAQGTHLTCDYQTSSEPIANHEGGLWTDVDLLHQSVASLQLLHDGKSGEPVAPGGPDIPPIGLVHAQICLSDPSVAYSECPNNYPANDANRSYGYSLNPNVIPLLMKGLAHARQAGLKVILRFTYNWPCGSTASGDTSGDTASTAASCPPGNDNDAPIGAILEHLTALAPVIRANSDVIFGMQAGFIGQWGEWHNSTSGNDNKWYHDIFLDQLTRLLGSHVRLEVRRPYAVMDFADFRYHSTDDAHLIATGLGMHDDQFGSDKNDGSTFLPEMSSDPGDPTPYTTCQMRHATDVLSGAYTMTGETAFGYGFDDPVPCDDSIPKPAGYGAFAAAYHLSTLQLKFAPSVWSNWVNNGFYRTVLASVGPHISITSATFSADSGASVDLELTLHNAGWAAIPHHRSLLVSLAQPGIPTVTQETGIDLSTLGPGSDLHVDVGVPTGSLRAGSYQVYLNSPDPSAKLSADPRYGLLLENDAVPNPSIGMNLIGALTVSP